MAKRAGGLAGERRQRRQGQAPELAVPALLLSRSVSELFEPFILFASADGIILYQRKVDPGEPILDIKGKPYSLCAALRDNAYDRPSLVVATFMTFFDVHVNRIPPPCLSPERAILCRCIRYFAAWTRRTSPPVQMSSRGLC